MRFNGREKIGLFILFCIELFIIYTYRDKLITWFSFLGNTVQTNYDNIFVGLIGSILFSILQVINLYFLSKIIISSREGILNLFENVFKCTREDLEECRNKMMDFIFSTQIKWGVTRNSIVFKNANAAEGLIACANAIENGYRLSDTQKHQIENLLDELLANTHENGYKSFNEAVYTVHCTSMVLYAIKRFVDLGMYEMDRNNEEKIRECLYKLLENANDHGWGFENKLYVEMEYVRVFSTLWALRALNLWDLYDNRKYKKILNNLITNRGGMLGFSIGSTAKTSTTAMLCILANEMKNKKIKAMLMNAISKEKILPFLLQGLKNEVEGEEFYVDIAIAKKLPWTHLSTCISIDALTIYMDEMSFCQLCRYFYNVGALLKKIDKAQGFYVVEKMDFNYKDPFFYPTAYLITTICNISNLRGGQT